MRAALKQVKENKGAGGIDGIQVDELGDLLREVWPQVREQLIHGSYRTKPVRRVEIPKPGRQAILDRLIQQGIYVRAGGRLNRSCEASVISCRNVTTQGQQREEQRGPAVEAEVPEIQYVQEQGGNPYQPGNSDH